MRRILAVCSCFFFFACSADPTQLVVVVDSNLAVPSELSTVSVKVNGVAGVEKRDFYDFNLAEQSATLTLPFSFGVAPIDGNADSAVVLEFTVTDAEDKPLFTRRVVTGFREGKRLLLPVYLEASCIEVAATCPDGQTCTENGCEVPEIPASSLTVVSDEPEAELQYDAGLHRDAAMTALSDSGARPDSTSTSDDAAMDAGVVMEDSGVAEDSGAPSDAQVSPDANESEDAALVMMDASTTADSGVASDSGTSPDAGTVSDAGTTGPATCSSLSFDGVDDLVEGPGASSIPLTTEFTVAGWFYLDNDNSVRDTLVRSGGVIGYNLFARDSQSRPGIQVFDGSGRCLVRGRAADITAGDWIHLAGTYDGSSLKLYVNGVLSTTGACNRSLAGSVGNLYVGYEPESNPYFFNGKVDEVANWSIAHDNNALQQLYLNGVSALPASDLEWHWNFNESVGTTVNDSSGNMRNGVVNGATWSNDCVGANRGQQYVCGSTVRALLNGVPVIEVDSAAHPPADIRYTVSMLSENVQRANGRADNLVVETPTGSSIYSDDFSSSSAWSSCSGSLGNASISGELIGESDWQHFQYSGGFNVPAEGIRASIDAYWSASAANYDVRFLDPPTGNLCSSTAPEAIYLSAGRQNYGSSNGPPAIKLSWPAGNIDETFPWNPGIDQWHNIGLEITPKYCALIGTANNPGTSCEAIKSLRPNAGGGSYWIDPDGVGNEQPFRVSCNMHAHGGGWTLVFTNNIQPGDLALADVFLSTASSDARETGSQSHYVNSRARYMVPMTQVMIAHNITGGNITNSVYDYDGVAPSLLSLTAGSTLAYNASLSTGRLPEFYGSSNGGTLSGEGTYQSDFIYFRKPANPSAACIASANPGAGPPPHRQYVFSHYDADCLNQAGLFCWAGRYCQNTIFGDVLAPPYTPPVNDGFILIYVRDRSLASGLSVSQAGESCLAIKTSFPSSTDGTYWIDPDGVGGNAAFEVYCDMTTDGGGWMMTYMATAPYFNGESINNSTSVTSAPTAWNQQYDLWNVRSVLTVNEMMVGCTTQNDTSSHYWVFGDDDIHRYWDDTTTSYGYFAETSMSSNSSTIYRGAASRNASQVWLCDTQTASGGCDSARNIVWGGGQSLRSTTTQNSAICETDCTSYGFHISPIDGFYEAYPICNGSQTSNGKFWIGVR